MGTQNLILCLKGLKLKTRNKADFPCANPLQPPLHSKNFVFDGQGLCRSRMKLQFSLAGHVFHLLLLGE